MEPVRRVVPADLLRVLALLTDQILQVERVLVQPAKTQEPLEEVLKQKGDLSLPFALSVPLRVDESEGVRGSLTKLRIELFLRGLQRFSDFLIYS